MVTNLTGVYALSLVLGSHFALDHLQGSRALLVLDLDRGIGL
jgi:hypothetical protein